MKKNSKKHNIIAILLIIISSNLMAQILTLNDIRSFTIDNNTIIRKDGIVVNQQKSIIVGTGGFKIRFRIAKDVNSTISQGTFVELDLISDIKGPVTSLSPLTILDQRVFATAETVLENIAAVASLQQGDVISVSGAINSGDNSMQLSRLELDNALTQWQLRGFARNITANNFTIGNLTINTNAVTATGCSNGFVENVFVEIKATPDTTYVAGSPLTTLTGIECQTPDVYQDSNNSIPIVVEAMVSEIIDLSSFKVNDLVVFFDANTNFDNGAAEHIDVGTKLEIQGIIDTNTRFVNAATIRFVHHRVKFEAPIMPADIVIGQSITFFGKEIQITPQTRDDDDIMSAGLSYERQVEVRGFMDSAGNLFARRIRDKGTPDSQDIELRGDITAINQPMIEVNGVSIDASSSLFEIDDDYVDINTFFSMIQVGMQMEIEEATYDANTQVLSGGTLELVEQELEDSPDGANTPSSMPITRVIVGTGGIGMATVTKVEIIEHIFSAGFE